MGGQKCKWLRYGGDRPWCSKNRCCSVELRSAISPMRSGYAACRAATAVHAHLKPCGRQGSNNHAFAPARVLSGGEQQRLCLARALSLDPDVVFLDEPTASLDPASTLAIERLLVGHEAPRHKVIMVTHDVGQARRLANEIIFLNSGRVVEQQPASRFFRQPESIAGRAFIAGDLLV